MLNYKTSGMTCQSCVRHITASIQMIDPKASVAVDLSSQIVSVVSSVPADAVAGAIEKEGYPVLSVTELQGLEQS
ncbi:MAG: heavy-metal-associated domain-containing protein [Spirochaetia bacterium]|nr:heavy-metal-associated domain-containing protein [Spirochaetia bacterium]